MKYIFICILSFSYIFQVRANEQVELLEKAKSAYIETYKNKLKKYCNSYYPKSLISYDESKCLLQIKFDCKYSKQVKVKSIACNKVSQLTKIESLIVETHKNINSLLEVSFFNDKSLDKNQGKQIPELEKFFTKTPKLKYGTPDFSLIDTEKLKKLGNSSDVIIQTKEGISELKRIQKEISDIKRLDITCLSDTDCKILFFGKRLCGGAEGSFIISIHDTNYSSIDRQVKKFNQLDETLQGHIKGFGGLCSVHGHPPPKCLQNRCQ